MVKLNVLKFMKENPQHDIFRQVRDLGFDTSICAGSNDDELFFFENESDAFVVMNTISKHFQVLYEKDELPSNEEEYNSAIVQAIETVNRPCCILTGGVDEKNDTLNFSVRVYERESVNQNNEENNAADEIANEFAKFITALEEKAKEQSNEKSNCENECHCNSVKTKSCNCKNEKSHKCKCCSEENKVEPQNKISEEEPVAKNNGNLDITKVIYNKTATIVFFSDGTKTIAKCDDEDEFNPIAGFAIAVCKKFMGNSDFHKDIKKFCYNEYKSKNKE